MSTMRFAALSLVLLAASSVCSIAKTPPPRAPKAFLVGGKNGWTFGVNYTEWAVNNGPFIVGDSLVFKYAATPGHSVYLLKDCESFKSCNLAESKKIADVNAGGSRGGFKLTLNKTDPYFIACGEHNGDHCNAGMKFAVRFDH